MACFLRVTTLAAENMVYIKWFIASFNPLTENPACCAADALPRTPGPADYQAKLDAVGAPSGPAFSFPLGRAHETEEHQATFAEPGEYDTDPAPLKKVGPSFSIGKRLAVAAKAEDTPGETRKIICPAIGVLYVTYVRHFT